MDNEPGTSMESDKDLPTIGGGWTKSLKDIPDFKHLCSFYFEFFKQKQH